jgi:hypothetical protein
MSLQKQSEIAADFTKKFLKLISKTNKELQKIDANSLISDININYLPSYPWYQQDRISLTVSVKMDAKPITNNSISNFTVEITE